jgi:hypothetical protein
VPELLDQTRAVPNLPQFKHLDEEVAHIAPAELKVWEAHELEGLIDTLEKHAKSAGNPFVLVPYMRRSVAISGM